MYFSANVLTINKIKIVILKVNIRVLFLISFLCSFVKREAFRAIDLINNAETY